MAKGTFWNGFAWALGLAVIGALILRRIELRVRFGIGQDLQIGSKFRYGQDIQTFASR